MNFKDDEGVAPSPIIKESDEQDFANEVYKLKNGQNPSIAKAFEDAKDVLDPTSKREFLEKLATAKRINAENTQNIEEVSPDLQQRETEYSDLLDKYNTNFVKSAKGEYDPNDFNRLMEELYDKQEEICNFRNQLAEASGYVDINSVFNILPDANNAKLDNFGNAIDYNNLKMLASELADKTVLTDEEALYFTMDDKGNIGKKVSYNALQKADVDGDKHLSALEIDEYITDIKKDYPDAIDTYYEKEAIRGELGVEYVEKGDDVASNYKYNLFNGTQNYEQAKDDGYYVDFNETKLFRKNGFYEFLKDETNGDVSKEKVNEFYEKYNLDNLDDLKQLKTDMASGKSFDSLYKNNSDLDKLTEGNDSNDTKGTPLMQEGSGKSGEDESQAETDNFVNEQGSADNGDQKEMNNNSADNGMSSDIPQQEL